MTAAMRHAGALLLALVSVAACGGGGGDSSGPQMTRAELLDPKTCKTCHAEHYREWSGSMHAYASVDPTFVAMNRKGQDATGGALGDFCVKCHAPMAVREGATKDGSNLSDLPAKLQGVTCYFCHNVERVEGTHNNPLVLSNNTTMRGGIADPVENRAHESEYSALLDGVSIKSTELCGPCHDLRLDTGFAASEVHLERTYEEWQTSLFNTKDAGVRLTCAKCHMDQIERVPIADAPGVIARARHTHRFPGVDVALSNFPASDSEEQQTQLDEVTAFLQRSLLGVLCVSQTGGIKLILENTNAGHAWPSGAAQDRRAWVELTAYSLQTDGTESVVYQTGAVPDDRAAASTDPYSDPDFWLLRDRALGATGEDVHMFWEVASIESNLLPPPDLAHNNRVAKEFVQLLQPAPSRVTVRVRMRPMDLDVLGALAPDYLDPALAGAVRTFDVLNFEWTKEAAADPNNQYTSADDVAGIAAQCISTAPTRM